MPKRSPKSHRESLLARLKDPAYAAQYLNAAFAENDVGTFLLALRNVSEARHLSRVAVLASIARESVYRMLSRVGNPTLGSLTRILRACGLKLVVQPETDTSRVMDEFPPAFRTATPGTRFVVPSFCNVATTDHGFNPSHPSRYYTMKEDPAGDTALSISYFVAGIESQSRWLSRPGVTNA